MASVQFVSSIASEAMRQRRRVRFNFRMNRAQDWRRMQHVHNRDQVFRDG
jgi:hypothetical protein